MAAAIDGPKIALHEPGTVGLCSKRLDRMDGFLQGLVDEGKRPHVMALVARHNRPVYCKRFGFQNDGSDRSLQPQPVALREDSIFRVYSMTKPLTSMAIMMLHEEGKIQLTDPAWLYLGKEWKKRNMRVWKGGGDPNTGDLVTEACQHDITVMHLLTHTSGLSYGFDPMRNGVDYIYMQEEVNLHAKDETLHDFVGRLAKCPLLFQPGTCWHYGFNTDVCGMIVEVVSGMTLADFFRERIFEPLGMVDTGFFVPPEKQHRLADIFTEKRDLSTGKIWLKNVSRAGAMKHYTAAGNKKPSGGGGLVSTMHDYLRFCQCFMNGGELDGARLLRSCFGLLRPLVHSGCICKGA
eukprot:TRINITY_DN21877_c0_g1_i3.p1 TRINITY_DN21877_c0_g1~~TRINITY_DN21877_c0_g1_i3.p1  ORF type:complete len:368 (-),score=51.37 TRINITY_DN21877_c0_g1_i3:52-1101(-)